VGDRHKALYHIYPHDVAVLLLLLSAALGHLISLDAESQLFVPFGIALARDMSA